MCSVLAALQCVLHVLQYSPIIHLMAIGAMLTGVTTVSWRLVQHSGARNLFDFNVLLTTEFSIC